MNFHILSAVWICEPKEPFLLLFFLFSPLGSKIVPVFSAAIFALAMANVGHPPAPQWLAGCQSKMGANVEERRMMVEVEGSRQEMDENASGNAKETGLERVECAGIGNAKCVVPVPLPPRMETGGWLLPVETGIRSELNMQNAIPNPTIHPFGAYFWLTFSFPFQVNFWLSIPI